MSAAGQPQTISRRSRPAWRALQALAHDVRLRGGYVSRIAPALSVLLLTWTPALAVEPERFPPYSHVQLLRADASLRAVAFADDRHGVACGDRGAILTTDDGGESWTLRNSGVECRLSDVIWLDQHRLVVVGGGYDRITRISRAVVLISEDGGNQWRSVSADELPSLHQIQRRADGTLIVVSDWSHAMFTNRYESRDGGQTWLADQGSQDKTIDQSQRGSLPAKPGQFAKWVAATGVPVVIRDACRVGETTLFAVGDHGVILVSRDGGRTWSTSRGAGRQTSVLMIASDPTSVAWGLLGKEALEHRNRVALLIDQPSGESGDLVDQVAVMLGGVGADLARADEGDIRIMAGQWIAVHRPSVLVLDHELELVTRDAFIKAATAAGVYRVVIYRRGNGPNAIHRDALLPNSGILVSDCANDAYQFIAPDRSASESIALQYYYDSGSSDRRGDSVAGGVPLNPGQTLAVALPPASRRQLQTIQARRSQSVRVQKLIASRPSPSQFAQALTMMLDQTVGDDQFRLAWSMLQEAADVKNSASAAAYQQALLDQIVTRFSSPAAGHFSAAQWARLLSDSRAHSVEWNRLSEAIGSESDVLVTGNADRVPVSPFQEPNREVQQVSAVAPLLVPKPDTIDARGRSDESTSSIDLAWEFHPLVLISREAARQRGDDGKLQSTAGISAELKRLVRSADAQWSPLVRPSSPHAIVAHRTARPPKLDAVLSEDCWRSALTTAAPTQIRLAYDDQFLYVGFECSQAQMRTDMAANEEDRGLRDRDLTQVDRLQLLIDIDRDLLTSFQFCVSARGQTNDGIDGNLSWNPTWYRETRQGDGRVTIELAILRRDLVDLPIHAGQSWYVSARPVAAGEITTPLAIPNPTEWVRVEFR